eukprot:TRINITY_DN415_c0_g1_i3.p1 TRINITY_DN415_c0_g1~~TRINITY_DN415_c0_g1_i3.p1  ORF type:complete len:645 (+),score=136.73 TRINITY_DN415_c0_g1_i3:145-2079(+)
MLYLYQGNKGKVYKKIKLSGVIKDQSNGYGTIYYEFALKNATTSKGDGFALVDASGAVMQFLSYGGIFTATDGPCQGTTSTLIPVTETKTTRKSKSLQLIGIGSVYSDFVWTGPKPESFGLVNSNQTFIPHKTSGLIVGPVLHFRGSNPEGNYKLAAIALFKDASDLGLLVHPKPKQISNPEILLSKGSYRLVKYEFTVQQEEKDKKYSYEFSKDKKYEFSVPGLGQPVRFGYTSCNAPQSKGRIQIPSDNLWTHMCTLPPFHITIHGGDQVYTDLPYPWIWKTIPALKGFTSSGMRTVFDTKFEWTTELENQVDDFYFNLYRRSWSVPSIKTIFATSANVMMWDDHDIFDGYGSYSDSVQQSNTFRKIFGIAKKYFCLFQLGCLPESPPSSTLADQDHLSQMYYVNGIGIASLDLRSERSKSTVLSDKTWKAFQSYLDKNLKSDIHHLLVLSSVPVVYNVFQMTEKIMEGTKMEVEDDLGDHWGHSQHKKEQKRFVKMLLNFAETKKCRVSIISGDVHVGCCAVIVDQKKISGSDADNACVINNITSSAIGSMAPHGLFVGALKASAIVSMKSSIGKNVVGGLHLFDGHTHLGNRNYLALEFEKDNSLNVTWYLEKRRKREIKTKVINILPYTKGKTLDVSFI